MMLGRALLRQLTVGISTLQRQFKPPGGLLPSREVKDALYRDLCAQLPLGETILMLLLSLVQAQGMAFFFLAQDIIICCSGLFRKPDLLEYRLEKGHSQRSTLVADKRTIVPLPLSLTLALILTLLVLQAGPQCCNRIPATSPSISAHFASLVLTVSE